jgi:hypothetical protein
MPWRLARYGTPAASATNRPFCTMRLRDFHLSVTIRRSLGELDSRCRDVHDVEFLGQGFDHHADIVEVALEQAFAQRRARQLQALRL